MNVFIDLLAAVAHYLSLDGDFFGAKALVKSVQNQFGKFIIATDVSERCLAGFQSGSLNQLVGIDVRRARS